MTGLQPIAEMMTAGALSSLLAGIVFGAFAWILLSVFQPRDSGTRFVVWLSALLAIAAVFLWPAAGAGASALSRTPKLAIPGQWAIYAFYAWAAIALCGMLRVGAGLLRLRRLRRNCVPIGGTDLSGILGNGCDQLASARRARICICDQVRVPTALGFFHPAVILPAWTVRELSSEELNSVVLHELAHLDRWDDWTNLAQKLIRAALFFHPAVWWIDSRLSIEREMACDDVVLAHATSPRGYAGCLVTLAEKSFVRRPLEFAHAAVSRVKETAQRIARILNGEQRTVTPVWRPALAASAAFSLLCVVAVRHTSQLVRFDHDTLAATHTTPNTPVHAAPAIVQAATVKDSRYTELEYRQPRVPRSQFSRTNATLPIARPAHNEISRKLKPNATNGMELSAQSAPPARRVPMAINASMQSSASSQVWLVMFEVRQYDGAGGMVITTWVGRIRVATPAAAGNGSISHST